MEDRRNSIGLGSRVAAGAEMVRIYALQVGIEGLGLKL